MNYRHAFHAGNHADVLKHAVLLELCDALCAKPAPQLAAEREAADVGQADVEDREFVRARRGQP